MTSITLPRSVVHALRHPAPEVQVFTPTKFCPAATKSWFAVHYLRFVSSDFPRHQFTHRFYNQLMHCYGFIAHYDIHGFWTEYFTSNVTKMEFLKETLAWPCHGSPQHTWCDVERETITRLRRSGLLDFYRQQLSAEQNATERAELARLMAKYGQGSSSVDPGVLRTVLVPMNQHPPAGRPKRRDKAGQLALGF